MLFTEIVKIFKFEFFINLRICMEKTGFYLIFTKLCKKIPFWARYRPKQYQKSVENRFMKFSYLAHLGKFFRKKTENNQLIPTDFRYWFGLYLVQKLGFLAKFCKKQIQKPFFFQIGVKTSKMLDTYYTQTLMFMKQRIKIFQLCKKHLVRFQK